MIPPCLGLPPNDPNWVLRCVGSSLASVSRVSISPSPQSLRPLNLSVRPSLNPQSIRHGNPDWSSRIACPRQSTPTLNLSVSSIEPSPQSIRHVPPALNHRTRLWSSRGLIRSREQTAIPLNPLVYVLATRVFTVKPSSLVPVLTSIHPSIRSAGTTLGTVWTGTCLATHYGARPFRVGVKSPSARWPVRVPSRQVPRWYLLGPTGRSVPGGPSGYPLGPPGRSVPGGPSGLPAGLPIELATGEPYRRSAGPADPRGYRDPESAG